MKSRFWILGVALFLHAPTFAAKDVILPMLINDTAPIQEVVDKALKNRKDLTDAQRATYSKVLTQYLAYLGVTPGVLSTDPRAKDDSVKTARAQTQDVVNRILTSSIQFLDCDKIDDWECLEKMPGLPISPDKEFRVETAPDLGKPVYAGKSLSMSVFYTQRFDETHPDLQAKTPKVLASVLAKTIEKNATAKMKLALYGIDDIEGSMKPVYDAITGAVDRNVEVEGVFDSEFMRTYDVEFIKGTVEREIKKGKEKEKIKVETMVPNFMELFKPILFTYVSSDPARWMLGRPTWLNGLNTYEGAPEELVMKKSSQLTDDAMRQIRPERLGPDFARDAREATRLDFQYNPTKHLIAKLNAGIKDDQDAKGRAEWPPADIMHNKFIVMENSKGAKGVWTGTTNVARTCMGDEINANMAIFIKNSTVADTFEAEFNEMFNFDSTLSLKDRGNGSEKPLMVNLSGTPEIPVGRFHQNKRPNTKRFFYFKDGTQLRVHFSPTDDGEHRAVVPMLLSARKGDIVRVAMFGGAGIELTRAFQIAVAKGADVRIVLDGNTGFVNGSWTKGFGKNIIANKILDPNPFVGKPGYPAENGGSLRVTTEAWGKGLLHHKSASLTRKMPDGSMRPEMIVIGSQNWSDSGNDGNDENMVSIRNTTSKKPLKFIAEYNDYFDNKLYPAANVPAADVLKASDDKKNGGNNSNPTSPTGPAAEGGATAGTEPAKAQ